MIDRLFCIVAPGATATLAAIGIGSSGAPASGLKLGDSYPFSFHMLIGRAKALASRPYMEAQGPPGDILNKIDYDAHGKISYKPEYALFANGPDLYPITFFHLGLFFRTPVRMHVVENAPPECVNPEINYRNSNFYMPSDSAARLLAKRTG